MNNTVTNTWSQILKPFVTLKSLWWLCYDVEHSYADKNVFCYFSYIIDLGLWKQDLLYEMQLKNLRQLFKEIAFQ